VTCLNTPGTSTSNLSNVIANISIAAIPVNISLQHCTLRKVFALVYARSSSLNFMCLAALVHKLSPSNRTPMNFFISWCIIGNPQESYIQSSCEFLECLLPYTILWLTVVFPNPFFHGKIPKQLFIPSGTSTYENRHNTTNYNTKYKLTKTQKAGT
jgi:hypothetical protein